MHESKNITRIGIIILISVFFGMIINPKISFGWWNNDWKYRMPINVSYEGSLKIDNYQLRLIINYHEGMQCDFRDIRFTEIVNGKEIEIPYFIENYTNCQKAFVWIKMPELIPGENKVYLYFGNSDASSKSSSSEVFAGNVSNTVGCWHFDNETNNIVMDCSGLGNSIFLNNAYLSVGKYGYALTLNGVNSYAYSDLHGINIQKNRGITISFWLMDNMSVVGSTEWIINNLTYLPPIRLGFYTTGTTDNNLRNLVFYLTDTNSSTEVNIPISIHTWVGVAGVVRPYNSTHYRVELWINGNMVNYTYIKNNISGIITNNNQNQLDIGRIPRNNSYSYKIDELYIFNTSLSQSAIRLLSTNRGVVLPEEPMTLYFTQYAFPQPEYTVGAIEKHLKAVGEPCTKDDECETGHCAVDYDGSGAWCMPKTSCAHNGIEYKDGSYAPECLSKTSTWKCSAGIWQEFNCGRWSVCKSGKCLLKDSDGDGVPDKYDLCPGTPAGCEVYANGCPKVPFKYHIKNDISSSCPGSSIPVDPEHYCLSTSQDPKIKFYVGSVLANSEPYCDPLYGTEGWHDVEDGRNYCEFPIPESIKPGKYTLYAEYELGGRTYKDVVESGFVVKSSCSTRTRCSHGGHMESNPTYNIVFSNGQCKVSGGIYYCKNGATVSLTSISRVVPHCSDGARASARPPGLLAWVYSGNVFLAEKDNKYAGCSLWNPSVNNRGYLFRLKVGFRWACNIGWASGAKYNHINNIYTFNKSGKYTLYVDLINAVCDSPDYICPTNCRGSRCLCYIGTMRGDQWGFQNLGKYKIVVVDPELKFISTPSSPIKLDGSPSLTLTWKIRNTGIGDIDIKVAPVCPAGWKCVVDPTRVRNVKENSNVTITLTIYNKKPPAMVNANRIPVGINISYSDSYGLYPEKRTGNSVMLILDNRPPVARFSAPSGYGWSASDLPFKITCDDNPYTSYGTYGGCNKIYYLVVNSSQKCPQNLNSYKVYSSNPQETLTFLGKVTCPEGTVCKKKVCYAAEDRFGYRSPITASDEFRIDKQPPVINATVLPSPVLSSFGPKKEKVFIILRCDDGDGSGCAITKISNTALFSSKPCELQGNGEAICEFIAPDCTGLISRTQTYSVESEDLVHNSISHTYEYEIKFNTGCSCYTGKECYSGSCVDGRCEGVINVTQGGHVVQPQRPPSNPIEVNISHTSLRLMVGEVYRGIVDVKNNNNFMDTVVLHINTNPEYPWKHWVYFEGEKFSKNGDQLVINLKGGEEKRVVFVIEPNMVTISPITVNITAEGLISGGNSTQTMKVDVVAQGSNGAKSSLPGIELYNVWVIALMAAFLSYLNFRK